MSFKVHDPVKQERRIHFKPPNREEKEEKQNMAKANKMTNTESVKFYEYNGKKPKKPTKKDKVLLEKSLALANPITERANEIISFLKYVPGVIADFNYDQATVWVYVNDTTRSEALRRFLIPKHEFGGLALKVKLIDVYEGGVEEITLPPSYTVNDEAMVREFKAVFEGSGYEPKHQAAIDQYGTVWNFFEFPPVGVSYQADSLANICGFNTKLASEVVMDIFNVGSFHISSMNYDC